MDSTPNPKARKATGPRTAGGKRRSRRNALRYGIFARYLLLEGEERSEFEKLFFELRKYWRPVGISDELDVEHLAHLHWRRRRCHIAEAAIVSRSPGFVGTIANSDLPFQHLLRGHMGDGSTPVSPKVAVLECALEEFRKLSKQLAAPEFDFLEAMATLESIYAGLLDGKASTGYRKMVKLLIMRCAREAGDAKSAEATDFVSETNELIIAEPERFRQLRDGERSKDVMYGSLASLIPSQYDLDRILGCESQLSREIDRTENRIERRRRERRASGSSTAA